MDRGELEARCLAFGVAVFAFCRGWHGAPGGRGPGGQLVDCATSIGANYRATSRARSRAEFVSKLAIVVEEADEAVFWLEFAQRVHLGDAAEADRLVPEDPSATSEYEVSFWQGALEAPPA